MTDYSDDQAFTWLKHNWKPLTLSILASITIYLQTFLLISVAPRFEALFIESEQNIPLLTTLAITISNWVLNHPLFTFLLIGLINTALIWFFFKPLNRKMGKKLKLFTFWVLGIVAASSLAVGLMITALFLPILQMGKVW